MTVCIAAIAGKTVIGASDRLVTAGDVQFEPSRPKIRALTNSVVVMTAGDAWLQAEVLDGVTADVQAAVHAGSFASLGHLGRRVRGQRHDRNMSLAE